MAACYLRLVRDLSSSAAWGETGKCIGVMAFSFEAGELGNIPLPTLMPPRKTGTILFLVSYELALSICGQDSERPTQ
jgi:hypothetical protein